MIRLSIRSGGIQIPRVARFLGDSVTFGIDASDIGVNDWASLTAAALNWTKDNRAFPSAGIKETVGYDDTAHGWGQPVYTVPIVAGGDLGTQVCFDPVTNTSATFWLSGYNDMRFAGTNATALAANRLLMRAALTWRTRVTSTILQGNDDGWSYTGSWLDLTLPLPAATTEINARYIATLGATATITVTGTAITVAYLSYYGSAQTGAIFGVTIDGVTVGGVDTNFGATTGNQFATNYAIMATRFDGLSAGSHVLQLTLSTANFCVICFVAGTTETPAPPVYVSGPLRMATYTGGATGYNNGSTAAVTAYTSMVSDLVDECLADGRTITLVDVNALYNTATDISADTVHPNDLGMNHISQAFVGAV
jgi:hypothetical protein